MPPPQPTSVTGHKRRTDHGEVKVRPHRRKTRGGRGRGRKKSLPRRGWSNLKSAAKYAKRKKRATAVFVGVLGLGQITAFVGLRGVALAATTVVIIGTLVVGVAMAASGGGGKSR